MTYPAGIDSRPLRTSEDLLTPEKSSRGGRTFEHWTQYGIAGAGAWSALVTIYSIANRELLLAIPSGLTTVGLGFAFWMVDSLVKRKKADDSPIELQVIVGKQ